MLSKICKRLIYFLFILFIHFYLIYNIILINYSTDNLEGYIYKINFETMQFQSHLIILVLFLFYLT